MLEIQTNQRTPLNNKLKRSVIQSSKAKAKQEVSTWVNDEDNVLMLSPDPSVNHVNSQKDLHKINIVDQLVEQDNDVCDSNGHLIVPQKVNQTMATNKLQDEYSEYSAQILK